MVDGVIYMSSPDNAWAVDARDGTILWHYYWKTRGGTHTGNRGMGMWHNNLYLEVHDDYLICLDAKTGKERGKKEISASTSSTSPPWRRSSSATTCSSAPATTWTPGFPASRSTRDRRAAVDPFTRSR